jgi:hypothetical protein
VAIATDRVAGVLDLYEIEPPPAPAETAFVVRPLAAFQPKAIASR